MRVLASVAAACICVSLAGARAFDPENPTKDTFDHGVALYDAGKYEDAYKVFRSIEDENVSAMHNVAWMRRKGQGTKKDLEGAAEMYKRAAMAGDPLSQADLGEMLLKGEVEGANPKAAAQWLSLAAAAHHPMAEFELGELYEKGSGVEQDLAVARELYEDAAARGVPGAKQRLAALPAVPPSTPSTTPARKPPSP
jgi:TPR repeat protein